MRRYAIIEILALVMVCFGMGIVLWAVASTGTLFGRPVQTIQMELIIAGAIFSFTWVGIFIFAFLKRGHELRAKEEVRWNKVVSEALAKPLQVGDVILGYRLATNDIETVVFEKNISLLLNVGLRLVCVVACLGMLSYEVIFAGTASSSSHSITGHSFWEFYLLYLSGIGLGCGKFVQRIGLSSAVTDGSPVLFLDERFLLFFSRRRIFHPATIERFGIWQIIIKFTSIMRIDIFLKDGSRVLLCMTLGGEARKLEAHRLVHVFEEAMLHRQEQL